MDASLLKELNAARAAREPVLVQTHLTTGAQKLLRLTDAKNKPEMYADVFRRGKATTVGEGEDALFLSPYLPTTRLIMIGAVHISQHLAPMAEAAGFDPVIIDPRTGFASPDRFPGTPIHADWPQDVLADIGIDAHTALTALTHDPKIDDPALDAALKADCFYIGALGSRKTHGKRVDRLKAAGFNDDDVARIHAPIGLDIGAANPAEIAIAVMGEIILSLRKQSFAMDTAA